MLLSRFYRSICNRFCLRWRLSTRLIATAISAISQGWGLTCAAYTFSWEWHSVFVRFWGCWRGRVIWRLSSRMWRRRCWGLLNCILSGESRRRRRIYLDYCPSIKSIWRKSNSWSLVRCVNGALRDWESRLARIAFVNMWLNITKIFRMFHDFLCIYPSL